MKKLIILLGIAMLGAAAAGQPAAYLVNETRGSVNVWLPGAGDFDLYESGYGLEVQYRNWSYDPLGWALALGLSRFSADSDSGDVAAADMSDFAGSLFLVPFGGSLLYKLVDWQDWSLTTELGVRYVLAKSDIDFRRVTPSGGRREDLDIGDSTIGVVAADYERLFGEDLLLFAGVGYQFDLGKGDTTDDVGHLRDSELKGFFLRAGTRLVF